MATMAAHNSPTPGPFDFKPLIDQQSGPTPGTAGGSPAALASPLGAPGEDAQSDADAPEAGDGDVFERTFSMPPSLGEYGAEVQKRFDLQKGLFQRAGGTVDLRKGLFQRAGWTDGLYQRQEALVSRLVASDQSMQTWSPWQNGGIVLGCVSMAVGFSLMLLAPPAVSAIGFVIGVAGVSVFFLSGVVRNIVAHDNANVRSHAQAEGEALRLLCKQDAHLAQAEMNCFQLHSLNQRVLREINEQAALHAASAQSAASAQREKDASASPASSRSTRAQPQSGDGKEESKVAAETPTLTQPLLAAGKARSDLD